MFINQFDSIKIEYNEIKGAANIIQLIDAILKTDILYLDLVRLGLA